MLRDFIGGGGQDTGFPAKNLQFYFANKSMKTNVYPDSEILHPFIKCFSVQTTILGTYWEGGNLKIIDNTVKYIENGGLESLNSILKLF